MNEKQTEAALGHLTQTLKQNLQIKADFNGTTVNQANGILNAVADKQLAAMEIALIFERKFSTFEETCTSQLKKIDNLNREVKKLMYENKNLTTACTSGMIVFYDCIAKIQQ